MTPPGFVRANRRSGDSRSAPYSSSPIAIGESPHRPLRSRNASNSFRCGTSHTCACRTIERPRVLAHIVPSIPPIFRSMDTEPGPVVARTFTSVHEAHLAKSVLEAAGIEVALADEHVVSMNWTYSNAVGGVKALVPAHRLDEAQSLLDTGAVIEDPQDGPADSVADGCSQCGHSECESIGPASPLMILSWLLIGVPLGWPLRRRVCRRCGEPAPRPRSRP